MLSIVIPSQTDQYVERCLDSIYVSDPEFAVSRSIIIIDSGLSKKYVDSVARNRPDVIIYPARMPFTFSQAINDGVGLLTDDEDILILNDDTKIITPGLFNKIENMLMSPMSSHFGIIGLRIAEGSAGNDDQAMNIAEGDIVVTRKPVCFVAAVIPRFVWDKVGRMDEQFKHYGWEDTDYNRRVVDLNYMLGVTSIVEVTHGFGDLTMSGTYRRVFGEQVHTKMYNQSKQIFEDKWGTGPQLGEYESMVYYMTTPDASVVAESESVIEVIEPEFTDVGVCKEYSLIDCVVRDDFLNLGQVPFAAIAHGIGTDIEMDLPVIYNIAKCLNPKVVYELGVRQAISTRTIHAAIMNQAEVPWMTVIDPDESCARFLAGLNVHFVNRTGEDAYRDAMLTDQRANLIFIDTDPHTYWQTVGWLGTWVQQKLAVGGCAIFHDTVPARPEIEVSQAVRDWIRGRKEWKWIELPIEGRWSVTQGSIGILWRVE